MLGSLYVTHVLLQTKLRPPRLRGGLVDRSEWIRRLEQERIEGRRLTLISAPAGSGWPRTAFR